MSKLLTFLLCTSLLTSSAFGQQSHGSMVPDVPGAAPGANSDITSLTSLNNLKLQSSGAVRQTLQDTASSPQLGYILHGGPGAGVTTDGATFTISRLENMPSGACPTPGLPSGNPNNTECSVALLVIAKNTINDWTVVSAGTFEASTISTSTVNSSAQAINAIGYASGSTIGSGTGAFLKGVLNSSAALARAHGAEIGGDNETGATAPVSYTTLGAVDGIWLTSWGASLSFPESSALHIGQGATNGLWQEGVTVNQGTVKNTTFNDQSSSTTSYIIGQSHTTGIDATGATISGNFLQSAGFSVNGSGNLSANAVKVSNAASWTAVTNCGSVAGSTKCISVTDPNGNTMFIPAWGTY